MSRDLEAAVQRVGNIGGRTFLALAMGLAAVAGALGLMYLAWFTENHFTSSLYFEATVATPLGTVPNLQGTIGDSSVTYSTVGIESSEPLFGARMAIAVSEALYFLLFIAGCASVVLICRRLWKNRPFTVFAHWSLLVLGVLAGATALLSPWLSEVSRHLAAKALGFPGTATAIPEAAGDTQWIVTSDVFSFQDANHSLLALGVVLILLSLAFRRGTAMQSDSDGLV